MKRSFLLSAIAIGVYYLLRQFLRKEEEVIPTAPRKKHLTNAFSRAKEHSMSVVE